MPAESGTSRTTKSQKKNNAKEQSAQPNPGQAADLRRALDTEGFSQIVWKRPQASQEQGVDTGGTNI
eukprot:11194343-Heterocapsa_arctica.AAC.1